MAAGSADADVIVLAAQVGLFSGHGAGARVPVETGDFAFKIQRYEYFMCADLSIIYLIVLCGIVNSPALAS